METFSFLPKKNPKNYLDQNRLRVLSDELLLSIEDVFLHFGVEYLKTNKKYMGACPIHKGGADKSPWNLFYEGDYYKGNWKCRSHHCELIFKKSLIGLIRGLLSRDRYNWTTKGDKEASFNETIEWILAWLNKDFAKIEVDESLALKTKFISIAKTWEKKNKQGLGLSPDLVKSTLSCPSAYFQSRGYSRYVLDQYCVGDCLKQGKEMTGRAVVPIFDEFGELVIGVTGRSLHDKCDKCSLWHHPARECPNPEDSYAFAKWRHNKGFAAEEHLYNLWNAKKYIDQNHSVCLVESPGNTWKLIQNGVENVVATLGSHLTDRQFDLLLSTKALVLNLIYDNDKAGLEAAKAISERTSRTHNINIIYIPQDYNDISNMDDEKVKEIIVPQIVSYKL